MNRTVSRVLESALSPLKGLGLRRFSIVRFLLGAIKPKVALVDGRKLFLDSTDFSISNEILTGSYEAGEVRLIRDLVRKDDTVIDAGANIGFFTTLFCELANEGHVYAFEPTPRTFEILKKNVEANKFTNATLQEVAVGDRDGSAQIFINSYNKGDNRLYPSFGAKGVDVRIARLDSLVPAGTKIDLIKMDIQGYEVRALRGMKRILSENRDVKMIVECWPKGLSRAGTSTNDFFSTLKEYGFAWKLIDESGELVPITEMEYVDKFPSSEDGYGNLLCAR